MSRNEDLSILINSLDRVLKTVNSAEVDLKASTDGASTTVSTLGFSSILGLSFQNLDDVKKSLEMNIAALQIASKRY